MEAEAFNKFNIHFLGYEGESRINKVNIENKQTQNNAKYKKENKDKSLC